VELAFSGAGAPLPAWELDLGEGHRLEFQGKIDRVDLAVREGTRAAQCVVMDYKSGAKRIDPLLQAHGIQIQLPAYLRALGRLPGAARFLGVSALTAAGFFYVNVRGRYEPAPSRQDALTGVQEARRRAYCHRGRFSLEALPELDRLHPTAQSGQFNYRITSKGLPDAKYRDLVTADQFRALLDRVEDQLLVMGRRIFAGEARVDPYRRGNQEVACGQCSYRAVCRIDPWTHEYRLLPRPAQGEKA
jgi:ATP-dependent helicase/nuclease subunit B